MCPLLAVTLKTFQFDAVIQVLNIQRGEVVVLLCFSFLSLILTKCIKSSMIKSFPVSLTGNDELVALTVRFNRLSLLYKHKHASMNDDLGSPIIIFVNNHQGFKT